MVSFALKFEGRNADEHTLDLYDAAQAMLGFQRSLAITTHLVLNGQVITQAPSLKNAEILTFPAEEGSWKIVATIVGGLFALGTVPKDTPIGHLMHSAYDYVVSESLGFHVDYNSTLGEQYDRLKKDEQSALPILEQSRFDSVIEKCEAAIKEMHRPIIYSETATDGKISFQSGPNIEPLRSQFSRDTFEYLRYTVKDKNPVNVEGRVSSYNINTYKGRIYVKEEGRPIPFILKEGALFPSNINKITQSLSLNAADRFERNGFIVCEAHRIESRTGRLKSYEIINVALPIPE
ncbi:hypothetical protein [Sneathiella sp. HT1-7]|uniref:DUF7946 domain-containing protein n=1 Tax=Sneathiella sp. HT1-7 TaxID=2887192 RepID=UPI001D14122D|nr:hypothetical protein [Sneathiella sp. HT1-7]MCC3304795.1 hypothetical protein [Sneathiella sp. HT1-7]